MSSTTAPATKSAATKATLMFSSLAPRDIAPPAYAYNPFRNALEGLRTYEGKEEPPPPLSDRLANFSAALQLHPAMFPPDPLFDAFLEWAGKSDMEDSQINLLVCLYSGVTRKRAARALIQLRAEAEAARDRVIEEVGVVLVFRRRHLLTHPFSP